MKITKELQEGAIVSDLEVGQYELLKFSGSEGFARLFGFGYILTGLMGVEIEWCSSEQPVCKRDRY